VYWLQAPSVSGDKDGSELALALAFNGVAHPPGYPLYTLAGHLFVQALHGLGAGWAWAANAWSGVGGAVAVFFFHASATRLLPRTLTAQRGLGVALPLLPALLFGLNPIWTYEAALAEVYSWHLAWVGAAVYYFLWLLQHLGDEHATWSRRRSAAHAAGWGLLCGAGGAHHLTAIFAAAPLSLIVLWTARRAGRRRVEHLVLVLLGACVPLASYAFLAYRAAHPATWQWPALEPSWESVSHHIFGSAYQGFFGTFEPSEVQRTLLAKYIYPFLFPGLLLLAVAAGTARHRVRAASWTGLGVVALLSTGYAFSYGVPDPSSYFLAPLALGLLAIVPVLGHWLERSPPRRRWAILGPPALVVLILSGAWLHTGYVREKVFVAFEERIHSMWASIPDQRAFVVWPNDNSARLVEFQLLRSEKRDLEILNPVLLMNPAVSRRFVERHGFNPIEGLTLAADGGSRRAVIEEISERAARVINERSPLPVILFDPERESVRMLRKPGGVSTLP